MIIHFIIVFLPKTMMETIKGMKLNKSRIKTKKVIVKWLIKIGYSVDFVPMIFT